MKQHSTSTSMNKIYQREHFVQFYQDEELLLNNLKSFIGGGLVGGEATLVIATPEHCQSLEDLLVEEGMSLALGQQVILMDAQDTLAKFMKDGLPNKELFRKVISKSLEQSTSGGRGVRAFGEMVALLWAQGNQAGAILLEQLWNEITREYSLTLFCAYPMHHFADNGHSVAMRELSLLHSSAIAPSPTPSLAQALEA